ncbi:hypothetical protein Rsub_03662 [Raphidocelis subcapitata]|uniref:Superkiller viralicidic activity 2-like n=1 Tax=Raphidocelis subcapitata TaxID=307507 RepID=A0A2V0NXD9_9CHLO|nr:hypothetical protein Rsub_03662 [Raphidocelis subcapitata]|eukprot:GBF91342.1 hypothetical protein Rsub_03662 [Raphidocelis subcapitata]
MDGTPEGLQAAASTREVLTKKRKALEQGGAEPSASKKSTRPPPTCAHEVARPEGWEEPKELDESVHGTLDNPVFKGEMAKQYPFKLDPFQATSIACLERRESVFVAAHTSAGKTVVAEYAIAMGFRDKQRVIYTSPIKALSNQKYRELAAEFGDVGLMTGDVTLNPNASVVVMTTEILRSMIYRGSEVLREVAWVVFDEVHYMQDRERGVVWEETIIFLDHATRMVFLSATLSNASEFAAWVAHLHAQPCHVVFTDYRPTPLHHYAFPLGMDDEQAGLYLLKDEKGNFRASNLELLKQRFQLEEEAEHGARVEARRARTERRAEAKEFRRERKEAAGSGGSSGAATGASGAAASAGAAATRSSAAAAAAAGDDTSDADAPGAPGAAVGKVAKPKTTRAEQRQAIQDGVRSIAVNMHNGKIPDWLPAIFFSFSKRECEMYARVCVRSSKGHTGLCFTTAEEQEAIEQVFDNAVQCLCEEDRALPAIVELRLMLKAGVGVHHGGLLPLMKEVVELLFQDGFVKMLFTTETFAMGLNMPARTVVFTSLTKWDGTETRYITSGEYIQMSGRAGRRGKDLRGNVVVLVDRSFDEGAATGVMMLSYYTLLNLMKRPEAGTDDLEHVIANSFQQFQRDRAAPKIREELTRLEAQLATIEAGTEAAIHDYRELKAAQAKAAATIRAAMLRPDRVLGFLRPGRLLRVAEGAHDWGWGAVVSVMRRPPAGAKPPRAAAAAPRDGDPAAAASAAAPASAASDPASYYIVDALLACAPGSVAAGRPAPGGAEAGAEGVVLPVALPLVAELSTLRVALPADLRPADARQSVLASLRDVARRYPDGPPRLDPVEDMGIAGDAELAAAAAAARDAAAALAGNEVFKAERDKTQFAAYRQQAEVLQRAAALRAELRGSALEKFREESAHRTSVMRRLGFVDAGGVVTLKGQAAACIDAADELLTAELMMNGVFSHLDKHRLAALVSCLVPVEKTQDEPDVTREMADPLAALQAAARRIAEVSSECGVPLEPDEYAESFRPTLCDVIYKWSKGASFADVCAITELYEGSIIRAARRLDELLTQLADAAAEVGDGRLAEQFKEAQASIRRDIVFAASLYI